ncbi:Pro-Pol polyprotein [Smittium mucronatum]|uniref:Pro-Pol polyprotein n=1 Tax=Smittium mucronatum TaxID=133383 RepID=A0A1R0GUX7_9FUNG|nr:Pro-Pol polyprotein [Smittium mucronatum]
MSISFEGLPNKFTGDNTNEEDFGIWRDKFSLVATIKGWEPKLKLQILELWLEKAALKWFRNYKLNNPETNLEKALEGLGGAFSKKKQGSVKTLMEMSAKSRETISEFNNRFRSYLGLIPTTHITDELIKDTYLTTLSTLDREIWWKIAQTIARKTSTQIMDDAETLSKIKERYDANPGEEGYEHPSQEKITNLDKAFKETTKNSTDPVADLAKSLGELVLLTKKGIEVTRSLERNNKRERTEEEKTALLALDGDEEKTEESIVAISSSKRMNLGSLVNNDYSGLGKRPISLINEGSRAIRETRTPAPEPKPKSKTKPRATRPSAIPRRILDAPAPISNAELLRLVPSLITSVSKEFNDFKKAAKGKFLLYGTQESSSLPRTYVVVTVNSRSIPMFIDTGAERSIIDSRMANLLQASIKQLDKPHRIKPVNGPSISLESYTKLRLGFEEDIFVEAKFCVIETCAVGLLLGIDILSEIGARLDYNLCSLTFENKGEEYSTQLYSKREIESLEISENEVDSESDYDDQEGERLVLLSTINHDLKKGLGPIEGTQQKVSSASLYASFTSNLLDTFDEIKDFLFEDGIQARNSKERQIIKNYRIIDRKLYRVTKKGVKAVLETYEELVSLLEGLHDRLGHPRFETTYEWVKERFWRPFLYKEVKHYTKSCLKCQMFQVRKPKYEFSGQSTISGIFDVWSMDFMGPFEVSAQGNRYILSAIEHLSGFPYSETFPSQTSENVLKFLKNLCALFGVPKEILCDNAAYFKSKLLLDFTKETKIIMRFNVAYQPEWFERIERLNGRIRQSLNKTCHPDFSNWDKELPAILLLIRSQKSASTGYSASELLYGVTTRLPITNENKSKQSIAMRKF